MIGICFLSYSIQLVRFLASVLLVKLFLVFAYYYINKYFDKNEKVKLLPYHGTVTKMKVNCVYNVRSCVGLVTY